MIYPKVLNKKFSQEEGVYVGRPSFWGNPFTIGIDGNRKEVIEKYKQFFNGWDSAKKEYTKKELKGKNLICWCAPLQCHADILLKFVNDDN